MAFSLFVLCFVTCSISGIVLFFFKAKQINARLKHPYLEHRAFNQYPLAIQAAIMLDYFFRLMFPARVSGSSATPTACWPMWIRSRCRCRSSGR